MTGNQIITLVMTVAITAIVTSVVGYIIERIKAKHKQKLDAEDDSKDYLKAVGNGTQCLLRAEIIRQYEKWIDRGFCPIYAKDALTKEYNSYHELGGNGTITGLYNELMELPDHSLKKTEE